MDGREKLVRLAEAREKAGARLVGSLNQIIYGVEERLGDEYYDNPDYDLPAFRIARAGLFAVRKMPLTAIRLARFGINVVHFGHTYNSLNPNEPLSTEQLAGLSSELAQMPDEVYERLTHAQELTE